MSQRSDTDFDAFVNASWPSLFRTSFLLMGDHQLAEDLLQTSLVKVYVAWTRVSKVQDPRAYARTVVLNSAMSWWRRRSATEVATPFWQDTAVAGHEDSVTQALVMWQALQQLPPRQRAVMVLRYYEDLSEAEIGKTLDISAGSVKTHAHHALRALARGLGAEAPDALRKEELP